MKTAREVCRAAGISRKALRVYRERKLLSPCRKSVQGYWLYEEDTLIKIRWIQFLKQLGFRLAEIRMLENAPQTELLESLAVKKQQAQQEMEELRDRICRIETVQEQIRQVSKENPDPQEE